METIKVLLFAANPHGTLPLDLSREFREIDDEVSRGPLRQAVKLILVPGARPVDLLRKLNENQPEVVHISSHGNPDELVLESANDQAAGMCRDTVGMQSGDDRDMSVTRPEEADEKSTPTSAPHVVTKSALVNVLRACDQGNLRLVVLNACHTRSQAESLTEIVDCVVSMNRTISDRSAILFAASFYGALAFGHSVQRAFEQGVARLSAEGSAEVDTPELVVRAGIDAAQIVLLGQKPRKPADPTVEAPFLVPFPRNVGFVGREGDLARLHASLSAPGTGPIGIRPAGLTGMGGIGKTQLAVEYVHRCRQDYPDGIFWIDAAGSLAEGFARMAADHRLNWAKPEVPRDERIRAAYVELNRRAQGLLVLDNLPDPAAIAVPLLPDCVVEDLRCQVLFTTRRHDLGRFTGVEVTVLPEEPALRLLLRHPSRQAVIDAGHTDHEHARAIARMLGRLPLALELAGAYLGKFSGDVSLEDYRAGLKTDGVLATLDADASELTEADLRRVHDPAVAATIGEQWEALRDESARLLLRVASLFAESVALPIARLGLLAGLSEEARPGRISPLRRAVMLLDAACLVEQLETGELRLHPLIQEFAIGRPARSGTDDLRRQCLARAATALEDFTALEPLERDRGVDALQEDLIAILELCNESVNDVGARLQALLRLLQREAHNVRDRDEAFAPTLFAQQVRNRASLMGISPLQSGAEARLVERGRPFFSLTWTASRESPSLLRTLPGHRDRVSSVALTSDSRHALSGSHDHTIRLWDLGTGRHSLTFTGHRGPVYSVAVTKDGRRVLSGSGDHTLRLWSTATGQSSLTLTGHGGWVRAVVLTADGRHALSGSQDGTLILWDLEIGQARCSFVGHAQSVRALVMTLDRHHALSGSEDCTVRLWDLDTRQPKLTFAGHKGPVVAVAITPDGRFVLSGSHDCTLKLWELATGRLVQEFSGHDGRVLTLAVTTDGRHAVSGSRDCTMRLWDLATGKPAGTLTGHEKPVTAIAVMPDGLTAVSGSDDHTLKVWDLGRALAAAPQRGHRASVRTIVITPDGNHAISASADHNLRQWDLTSGQPGTCFAGHKAPVSAAVVVPGGRHLLSGSDDGILILWDRSTGWIARMTLAHGERANQLSVVPPGRDRPFPSYDRPNACFDPAIVRFPLPFSRRGSWVSALAATPEGRYAVSGSRNGTLKVWILANGQLHRTLAGHRGCVNALGVTPDGRRALSGSEDRTIMLWDLAIGRLLRTFTGHRGSVTALAVMPDGRRALSASQDRTLILWDLTNGRSLHTFTGHESAVSAIALTPDGRHVLSGAEDGTLRLWTMEDARCTAMAPLENSPLAIAVASDGRTVVIGDRVGNVHQFRIVLG
jgi:WD40 repeat protein